MTRKRSRAGVVERIGQALRRAYEGRGATKAIARATDGDSRTAESWLYGKNAPRAPELVRLMADNPAFEAEIDAIVREIRAQKRNELSRQPPGAADAAGLRDRAPGGIVPSCEASDGTSRGAASGGVPSSGGEG